MKEEIRKIWMPVTKSADGNFVGILSDTSMDRDEEFMDKALLQDWASNKTLKALANHTNKMENWVGGWDNLKVIEKGNHTALVASPWFFSKEANPLAAQIQKQVEEALERGESPGISIGAIPKQYDTKTIDGKDFRVFTKAELVEATWVPIQSNRNATFGHIAKKFDYTDKVEETKMAEEVKVEPVAEVVAEEVVAEKVIVEEPVAEVVAEKPAAEEVIVEEVKEEVVAEEPVAEVDAQKLVEENKSLKAELEKIKTDITLKATVEGPGASKIVDVQKGPYTVEQMLKQGLKNRGI